MSYNSPIAKDCLYPLARCFLDCGVKDVNDFLRGRNGSNDPSDIQEYFEQLFFGGLGAVISLGKSEHRASILEIYAE